MNEPAPPLVKPEFVLVEDVFNEILSGKLLVPRFQRPFVWKPENMIDLFDSLRQGYPIGSLLFWDTDEPISSTNRMGPLEIKRQQRSTATYVLDGQQRISTLFGVLRLPPDHPRGPGQTQWQWWLYYDLKDQHFKHVPNGAVAPHLMPMRALLRTVDFIKESTRIQQTLGSEREEEANHLIEDAQSLVQKIRGYKITVVRIQGGRISDAVEIFSRLNTTGQKITKDQMLSALTYKEGAESFDLAGTLDRIAENLRAHDMGGVRRLVLLRAFVAAAGSDDVYMGEWPDYKKMSPADLSEIGRTTEMALLAAARFLSKTLRIPSDKLLPYSSQLIPLSELFRIRRRLRPEQRFLLCRWFWATSFSGWFAGINSTNMRELLEEFRRFAKGEVSDLRVAPLDLRARPFPTRFDLRSARLRALLLVMMQRLAPENLDGNPVDGAQLVREHGPRAFAHVFRDGPEAVISNPANRVLLHVPRGISVRRRLLDLADKPEGLRTKVLSSHAISDEAFRALEQNDANAFVRARVRALGDVERELMKELGIPPPPEEGDVIGEGDLEIDTDE